MSVCITGWAHNKFGVNQGQSSESMIADVVDQAIKHAEISVKDIDAIFVGTFNNGFQKQDFHGALPAVSQFDLRYIPAMRVENACATGSAAIHTAMNAIEAKRAKTTLVVGVEKMTDTPSEKVGDILLGASYRPEEGNTKGGFTGVFGTIAEAYFQKYGDKSDILAKIAAKNHKNGSLNPLAHMQKDLGFDFCNTVSDKNPYVAHPLRRTDCSMVSDGAAAMILQDFDLAMSAKRAIAFRARRHVNDILPISKREKTEFEGARRAWNYSLADAKMTLDDLSFVETHDCFTIAELIEYEAMGLTKIGEGFRAIEEGWVYKGGKLPINPSGGLKSKGHPVGATGVSQHVMAAMQLTGEAGDMQIKDANLAGIFNMGGASVANYVSILEQIR
ncbi:MAG: acetyl-CoA acetyltransferase [Proteobacteria bacterium]|jgi:acetyl-CoA C-acetyltransferase|nr:acetyl-CoA acetyltransferase [Pseudomonadota bacterium]MDA1136228.1 acetyl-CoA acetyltransferase [Pseudomonadota bacterium]